MKKKRKTVRAAAGARSRLAAPSKSTLVSREINKAELQAPLGDFTWQEERFIQAYALNGGNAGAAMREAGASLASCYELGSRMLRRIEILDAIEREKADLRRRLNFTRDQALDILIGMATASQDDFSEVLADPTDRERCRSLGSKRYAIESAKQTEFTTEDGGSRITNEIKIITPGERKAIINDLWEKLGLDKDASQSDRVSFLERFASLGSRLGRGKKPGEPTSGEGS